MFRQRSARLARSLLVCAVAASVALSAPASACTSFLLRAKNGDPVYGRTMEFGVEIQSAMAVVPRHLAITSDAAPADKAAKWSTRFGYVGVNAFGEPAVSDGLNEKGLAGGVLYFPGSAEYADPAKSDPAKSLAPWEVLSFVLSQASSVAEVRTLLAGMNVVAVPAPGTTYVLPLHYTFHDETGASLVVEPTGGTLKFFDNPLGVMTNSPSFDWHMTNLRNYIKISPVNAKALDLDGVVLQPTGQGSGLLGIPGDPTPPSRFIRALGYVLSVEQQADGPSTVRLAEHLVNNFDIPVGWIKNGPTEHAPEEITQWSSIADLKARKYYIKTYDNQTLTEVDLMAHDLDAKAMVQAPLPGKTAIPMLPF
jgi:choloylglycine hydrolase